jgi:ATP-dependent protease Clp ATPase subunit
MADAPALLCSFCGRHQHEVADIVKGINVAICDCCIVLARDIVTRARERWAAEAKVQA